MEKQHNPNDWVVKVVCSSDNETKMETISVYGGSEDDLMLIHQQIKPHFMLNRESAKTFVDRFLDNFNMCNTLPKRINHAENLVMNIFTVKNIASLFINNASLCIHNVIVHKYVLTACKVIILEALLALGLGLFPCNIARVFHGDLRR